MYTYRLEDIWKKIDIRGKDECWNWCGAIHRDGYGICQINYKQLRVHRIAYMLSHNENIDDKVICHHCDNPLCCNPEHLFSGTVNDNVQDKIRKGRARYSRGFDMPQSKLSEEQKNEIREIFKKGNISKKEIAKIYGVSRPNISYIVNPKKTLLDTL